MIIFIKIVGIILLGLTAIVSIGLFSEKSRSKKFKTCPVEYNPLISVIIPARNEAENLPALFESLEKQTYSNFEIILIDDRSEDNSLDLMNTFRDNSAIKVKVIENHDSPGATNPKVNVLIKGMKQAEGELYLFTDADCVAGEHWVSSLVSAFADSKTGIVCGLLTLNENSSPLCLFQNYDHFYRMMYAFGAIGLGHPVGCFGNNLAIRREAYLETGGYEELLHSATEDAELISRVKDAGNYLIRALFAEETFIETVPKKTWKEHGNQAVRWAAGAVFSTNLFAQLAFAALMLIDVFCLAGIILGIIIDPIFFNFPAMMYLFLLLSSIVFGIVGSVNKAYWKGLFVSVLLYPIIYVQSFFRTIITRKISWKGTIISWKREKKNESTTTDNTGVKPGRD